MTLDTSRSYGIEQELPEEFKQVIRRTTSPGGHRLNLWKLPAVKKDQTIPQLALIQKTYTNLLYQLGEKKYNIRPKLDFTVEIVIPEGIAIELHFHIIPGSVCHAIVPVCPIREFEVMAHKVLKQVAHSIRSKSLELHVEFLQRQEKIKKLIPAFQLYEELVGHKLTVKREIRVTVTDETTRVSSVIMRDVDEESNFRILAHQARLELIQKNEIIKAFEEKEKERKRNEQHESITV